MTSKSNLPAIGKMELRTLIVQTFDLEDIGLVCSDIQKILKEKG